MLNKKISDYAWFLPGIVLLLLQGCSSVAVQTQLLLENPPAELVQPVELSDTPFFPQKAYQCGPAALATILQSSTIDVDADALTNQVFIPDRQGSLQIEMLATTRKYDLIPYLIRGEMTDLLREVKAGNPVLVLQNLALEWYPQWHYAVVMGFNLAKKELYLRSGTIKRHVMRMHTFEHTWRRARYWGFVALPAGRLPETADAHHYMRSLLPFEEKKKWPLLVTAYQGALKRWPENTNLLMGQANVLLSTARYVEAENGYRQVLSITPGYAPAMNNLAESLLQQGKLQQAEEWAGRAVQAGGRYASIYQQTLDEIRKRMATRQAD